MHRTQLSAGKGMAALRLDAVLDVLSNNTNQDPSCERQEVIEKSEEAGSSTAERRHSDEEGCGLVSCPQVLSFPLRLEEKRLRPGFSLVMHIVFPSRGQVLSWDACAALGDSKDSSQCPYKGLGTGEAAEQPDSNTAGRSSEPSLGNSPKEKHQCRTSRPGI